MDFVYIGLPLYDPSKDFTCLDGSQLIRFSSVNDDYCDCNDGSDEPGKVKIWSIAICHQQGVFFYRKKERDFHS